MKDDPQPCVQGHCPRSWGSALLQKSLPGCMRKVEGGSQQNILGNAPLYSPDTKHSFLLWTLWHLVITSAVTFTVPLGLFITCPHPCLQMETQQHGHFHGGHNGRLRICFSNSDVGIAWKTGSALGESGSMA